MLLKRRKISSSFGPDGRRRNDNLSSCSNHTIKNNGLFAPGAKLKVRRAPIMCGLTTTNARLQKPFQRPMVKRRAYQKGADEALQRSSLGQRRRLDGMAKLMARAGRGLNFKLPQRAMDNENNTNSSDDDEESEDESEEDRPFEPLMVWQSPHDGGAAKGLPSRMAKEVQADEYGIEQTVTVLRPAPMEQYSKENVFVPPILAKWLRPHQREGVQFMYECVMGLRDFDGRGCILADDMGLGKTLQSVTLIYTLLKTRITAKAQPTAKRVIVVCPCSLVKNWENEFVKWLGPGGVKTLALAEADRKSIEKNLDCFAKTRLFQILICSYECLRTHVGRLTKYSDCCDLLVCDEAHRLKNRENLTSKALNSLPVRRRVLLTGTPMQNDLQEFFAMVDFTNPGILGTQEEFRRRMLFPILRGREPDATESQKRKMQEIQNDMSTTVNEFILRRVNTLNAQHLPPKLVQVVCCNLTDVQQNMYQHIVNSKDMQHVLDGKQVNCLGTIQLLMKLVNHPSLVADEDPTHAPKASGRRAAAQRVKYTDDPDTTGAATPGADGIAKFLPFSDGGGGRGYGGTVHPEWSGKMFVLYRLMKEMRRPGNGGDKIVIVSNYTQTLDLIGKMCRQNSWGFCRLDGSINMKKRQKMVEEFNDPSSSLIAFLLSSKAGGCGLNLIGGNRLVLFDPDWNPAVDKQAAARCWRDGQKKRCFTYRFLATGTVEEKIFQRQLSKEGLQSVVDDKQQVNELSTKDLRNLFKLRNGTPSDTHDKLRCERCKIIQDNAELEARKVLPKKLKACQELVNQMFEHEDSVHFHYPLVPLDHGVSKEDYEKIVKQPMDLGTIKSRLEMSQDQPSSYNSISGVSKDVNRIFSNVMKVWSPGDAIADAARKLQTWWVEQWTELVPRLMTMKADTSCDNGTELDNDNQGDSLLEGCSALNNERGQDYQEQIGMPDEENMRSWSHHHTTDTVDDPVFRAAMRGFDSVSFVFGLEVTWSLIQKRQQEEEERLAMKELEAIEEIEEETDTNSSPVKNEEQDVQSSDSSEEENEFECDMNEVIEQGHEVNNNEGSDEEMPSDEMCLRDETSSQAVDHNNDAAGNDIEDGTASGATITDEDGSNLKTIHDDTEGGDCRVSEGCSQDENTADEFSQSSNEQREMNKENMTPSPSNNEWECPNCTLFNKKSCRKCKACGSRRLTAGVKRSVNDL